MIKTILCTCVLMVSSTFCVAEEIKPIRNYWEAIAVTQEVRKPCFVVVKSKFCQPCKTFKEVVIDPILPLLQKRYTVYFLDIDEEQDVAVQFKTRNLIPVIPTTIIIDKDGKTIIKHRSGIMGREEFIMWHNGK